MSLGELRQAVQRWPSESGLYRLCRAAPPADPRRRPPNLRWILYDCGHYPAYARAFALGAAGGPITPAIADHLARAAWLAGWDSQAHT